MKKGRGDLSPLWLRTWTTDPPITDQPSPDHLLTDPPTNRPPTQKSPTQPTRFYFKDLINQEYLFYRTQTQLGRCKVKLRSIWWINFKPNCCTSPQIYHSLFLRMEISIRPYYKFLSFSTWQHFVCGLI